MNDGMQWSRNSGRFGVALMCVISVILGGNVGANAHAQTTIDGTWVGSDVHNDRPSFVRLVMDGGAASTGRLTVRFGASRNCQITAQRSDFFWGQIVYDTIESSGGAHCDALHPGSLTLIQDADVLKLRAEGAARPLEVALWPLGSPPPAGVEDPKLLLGTWVGSVTVPDTPPVGVSLVITGVEPGDQGNTLRYGGARRCSIPLAYEGAANDAHYFSVTLSGGLGGFCDRRVGRLLRVRTQDGRLLYSYEPGHDDCEGECVLDRLP